MANLALVHYAAARHGLALQLLRESSIQREKLGDRQGAALEADGVRETEGFAAAYRQYVDGGWAGLGFPEEYGGQGMPKVLFTATEEIWQSSNLGFSLCSLLTHGAVDALLLHGSEISAQLRVFPL